MCSDLIHCLVAFPYSVSSNDSHCLIWKNKTYLSLIFIVIFWRVDVTTSYVLEENNRTFIAHADQCLNNMTVKKWFPYG